MVIETSLRYEQISRRPTNTPPPGGHLGTPAVPLLDTVVKKLTDVGHERRLRQLIMANSIKLGPEQLPTCGTTTYRRVDPRPGRAPDCSSTAKPR